MSAIGIKKVHLTFAESVKIDEQLKIALKQNGDYYSYIGNHSDASVAVEVNRALKTNRILPRHIAKARVESDRKFKPSYNGYTGIRVSEIVEKFNALATVTGYDNLCIRKKD